jgi:hypothetical protein
MRLKTRRLEARVQEGRKAYRILSKGLWKQQHANG